MFKYILIFLSFLLLFQGRISAQGIFNINTSFEQRNSYLREHWFMYQRAFPENFIPEDAYFNALNQKKQITRRMGYSSADGYWLSIGPSPAYNSNYGYVSSRVAAVKYDPLNPSVIYLGAACGGIWKTTNSGLNWTPLSDFDISLASGSIAIDPANTNIIYCGTGEASYFTYSYFGHGLLKSTNGGLNWTNYRTGLPLNTYFSRLVVKPGQSEILFAAMGPYGLYKSTDAGFSWSLAVEGRCDDIVFSNDGIRVYIIGSGSGYRISSDGGNSFAQTSVLTPGVRNHIAVSKSAQNILYVSIYTGTDVNVYKSTDYGNSFILLPNSFTGVTQAHYDFYMHVNPYDPDNAFVGLVDLWRTVNGMDFVKITNTSAGPVHVDHHNMDFHPADGNKIIIATDGGLYYSTNKGTNWSNINSNLNLTQFYRIASDPGNDKHIIGGTQDNGTQRTTGALLWNVSFGGDGGEVCFHRKNNQRILAETQSNGVRRSDDGGLNWVVSTSGLTGTGAWIAPIVSHPDSAGIFFTARQQVFKSTDYGASWIPVSSGTSGVIRELAVSKMNPKVMYASSNNLFFRSTNGGVTFYPQGTNQFPRIITSINVHPDSSDLVLVTLSGFGGGHVYKTKNGGVTWTDISANLPDIAVNDGMIYYPGFATGYYLAATDVGVFVTNDYGSGWTELAAGLPNTVSMHLDYNAASNKLRVATHGRGVWEYTGNIIGINKIGGILPGNYNLTQNYPNPFNSSTKIRFSIPAGKTVLNTELIIYDILGHKVKTLVNQTLSAGEYEIVWNAGNHSGGIYFYSIKSGNYSEVRKMVLLK
jgi:photosystem II stability/assembly factor-like uncharacterized protein